MVQMAAHRNFEQLLRAGVQLLEYPDALVHQTVMTLDGIWSAVGSANFDDRSLDTNDEIIVGVVDEGLAARLDELFEGYASRSCRLELAQWRARPVWSKAAARACHVLKEWL